MQKEGTGTYRIHVRASIDKPQFMKVVCIFHDIMRNEF
jgi:hypothetical protein